LDTRTKNIHPLPQDSDSNPTTVALFDHAPRDCYRNLQAPAGNRIAGSRARPLTETGLSHQSASRTPCSSRGSAASFGVSTVGIRDVPPRHRCMSTCLPPSNREIGRLAVSNRALKWWLLRVAWDGSATHRRCSSTECGDQFYMSLSRCRFTASWCTQVKCSFPGRSMIGRPGGPRSLFR
jgi:hypothetical protein